MTMGLFARAVVFLADGGSWQPTRSLFVLWAFDDRRTLREGLQEAQYHQSPAPRLQRFCLQRALSLLTLRFTIRPCFEVASHT